MQRDWRQIVVTILSTAAAILASIWGVQVMNVRFGCTAPPQPPAVPQPDCDKSKPSPDDKKPDKPKPEEPKPEKNACEAIVKVIMAGGYCSGTIIGPPPSDNRWTIVSASHCFRRVGEQVEFMTRRGIAGRAIVIAINRKSDCAILKTEEFVRLPFIMLADSIPQVGEKVFHCGYGVHLPGNREDGTVLSGEDSNGQIRYRLSVSHGDSGGGIVSTEDGKLLSPVCCTTRIAGVGDVWGASPRVIRDMVTSPASFASDLEPIQMPIREEK
jgi:hypothetical protein